MYLAIVYYNRYLQIFHTSAQHNICLLCVSLFSTSLKTVGLPMEQNVCIIFCLFQLTKQNITLANNCVNRFVFQRGSQGSYSRILSIILLTSELFGAKINRTQSQSCFLKLFATFEKFIFSASWIDDCISQKFDGKDISFVAGSNKLLQYRILHLRFTEIKQDPEKYNLSLSKPDINVMKCKKWIASYKQNFMCNLPIYTPGL